MDQGQEIHFQGGSVKWPASWNCQVGFSSCELSAELLECPSNMAAGFFQRKWSKRPRRNVQCILLPRLGYHTLSPPPYLMDHTSQPWFNTEKDYTGHGFQEAVVEAGHHRRSPTGDRFRGRQGPFLSLFLFLSLLVLTSSSLSLLLSIISPLFVFICLRIFKNYNIHLWKDKIFIYLTTSSNEGLM